MIFDLNLRDICIYITETFLYCLDNFISIDSAAVREKYQDYVYVYNIYVEREKEGEREKEKERKRGRERDVKIIFCSLIGFLMRAISI